MHRFKCFSALLSVTPSILNGAHATFGNEFSPCNSMRLTESLHELAARESINAQGFKTNIGERTQTSGQK